VEELGLLPAITAAADARAAAAVAWGLPAAHFAVVAELLAFLRRLDAVATWCGVRAR
jgi:hypothetical protein